MKEIERDAKERADRRNKNEADVEKLKSKGNQEFKSGHYMEAVDYYTEAIKLVKYFPALYTNRAQVSCMIMISSNVHLKCAKYWNID